MSYPSFERVNSLISCNPETGVLLWKRSQGKARKGARAGCAHQNGYEVVRIDGKLYGAHCVVWLLCTGDWPPLIDHLNGIRSDNAFSNLRIADKNSNAKNRALFGNGKKLIGAYKTSNGTFVSAIISDGIRYYLGVFQDEQAAHQAYVNVRRELMAAEIAARKCVLSRFVKGPVRIDKAFNMAGLVMLQSDQAEKH